MVPRRHSLSEGDRVDRARQSSSHCRPAQAFAGYHDVQQNFTGAGSPSRWRSMCCWRSSGVSHFDDKDEPSISSELDNDYYEHAESHDLTRCQRRLRNETFGIKLRHWLYIFTFVLVTAVCSAWLWMHVACVAREGNRAHFQAQCRDRVVMNSQTMLSTLRFANMLSEILTQQQLGSLDVSRIALTDAMRESLRMHLSYMRFSYFATDILTSVEIETPDQEVINIAEDPYHSAKDVGNVVPGICVVLMVQHAQRAKFELHNGHQIVSLDSSVSPPVAIRAPNATSYAVVLMSEGLSPIVFLNLLSIPYYNRTLQKVARVSRMQVSEPYYVHDITAPVEIDGGVTSGYRNNIPDGVLSPSSGYRFVSATPIRSHNFSSSLHTFPDQYLSSYIRGSGAVDAFTGLGVGVVLCTWDLVNLLQFTHTQAAEGYALEAVIQVFSDATPDAVTQYTNPLEIHDKGPTMLLFNSLQQADLEAEVDAQFTASSSVHGSSVNNPLNLILGPRASMYIDASNLSLSLDEDFAYTVPWGARSQFTGMDWSSRCTPTTASTRNDRDTSATAVGALSVAAVLLVACFIIIQVRSQTLKEREVRFKNRVLLELQQERESADEANLSKSDFLAFVCHELRNPLHAVLSMSDSLRDTSLDAEQAESVFTIHASSELMLTITNDVLDLSKLAAGRLELEAIPVDVAAMVHSLVRANAGWAAEKGVAVQASIDPRLWELTAGLAAPVSWVENANPTSRGTCFVYADPTRLNQMMMNLLSNAIKFTGKQGNVALECEIDLENSHTIDTTPIPSNDSHGIIAVATVSSISDAPGADVVIQPIPAAVQPLKAAATMVEKQPLQLETLIKIFTPSPSSSMKLPQKGSESPVVKPRTAPSQTRTLADSAAKQQAPQPLQQPLSSNSSSQLASQRGSLLSGVRNMPLQRTKSLHSRPPFHRTPSFGTGLGVVCGTSPIHSITSLRDPRSTTTAQLDASSGAATVTVGSPGATVHFIPASVTSNVHDNGGAGTRVRDRSARSSVRVSPLISHAPAELQATLPPLLLARHKRARSSHRESPRLFAPSNVGGSMCSVQQRISFPATTADAAELSGLSPLARRRGGETQGILPPSPTPPSPAVITKAAAGGTTNTLPQSQRFKHNPGSFSWAGGVVQHPLSSGKCDSDGGSGPVSQLRVQTGGAAFKQVSTAVAATASGSGDGNDSAVTPASHVVRLIFRVRDTGIGIPSEAMHAIFEPYSQAKRSITRSHGGTGLGLAIVKRLSDLMHGEIEVHSEVGVGTTFSFAADFVVAPGPAAVALVTTMVRSPMDPFSDAGASVVKPVDIKPAMGEQPQQQKVGTGVVRYQNYYSLGHTHAASVMTVVPPSMQISSAALSDIGEDANHSPASSLQLQPQRPLSDQDAKSFKLQIGAAALVAASVTAVQSIAQQQPQPQQQGVRLHLDLEVAPSSSSAVVTDIDSPFTPSPAPADAVSPMPAAAIASSSIAAPALTPSSGSNKLCILVVDDAAINRKILIKMLAGEYEIEQAENGLEALNLVESNPAKYSCVLLDLMMPVMSGGEALIQLRARGHVKLPVIAVTANSMSQDIGYCLRIGFTGFLSKPARKEAVRAMVKQYALANPADNLSDRQQQPQTDIANVVSDITDSSKGSAGAAAVLPSADSKAAISADLFPLRSLKGSKVPLLPTPHSSGGYQCESSGSMGGGVGGVGGGGATAASGDSASPQMLARRPSVRVSPSLITATQNGQIIANFTTLPPGALTAASATNSGPRYLRQSSNGGGSSLSFKSSEGNNGSQLLGFSGPGTGANGLGAGAAGGGADRRLFNTRSGASTVEQNSTPF